MKNATGPKNHRELRLYSAGMYAGMRNVAMAQAVHANGTHRKQLVRHAREYHWTYLARLREASGTTGYYMPPSWAVL